MAPGPLPSHSGTWNHTNLFWHMCGPLNSATHISPKWIWLHATTKRWPCVENQILVFPCDEMEKHQMDLWPFPSCRGTWNHTDLFWHLSDPGNSTTRLLRNEFVFVNGNAFGRWLPFVVHVVQTQLVWDSQQASGPPKRSSHSTGWSSSCCTITTHKFQS